MHTLRRPCPHAANTTCDAYGRRHIHINEDHSNRMLAVMGVPLTESEDPQSKEYLLTVMVYRTRYTPCIITSLSIGGESSRHHEKTYPLGLDKKKLEGAMFSSIATDLDCQRESYDSLTKILTAIIEIFFTREGFSLTTRLSRNNEGMLAVARSSFTFDDAAFRSGQRQGDIQEMRDVKDEVPEELEAEKDGIVYIK